MTAKAAEALDLTKTEQGTASPKEVTNKTNKEEKILMKRVLKFGLYGLLIMLFLVGCAKQPQENIDAAKKAVDEGKAAGSDKYLPADAKKVNDSLAAALNEVKTQDDKFSLFRNYDKAKEMLAQAKSDAEKVKADIAVKKEEAKKNAMAGQEAVVSSLKEAKALLARAPMGKGSRADVEALKGDLKGIEDGLPELQQLIDKEDYLAANDKAKAMKEKADGIANQVKEAMSKVKVKKGAKGRK